MAYTNSSLVDCKVKSPNHSGKRTHKIDRISPHCVVGWLTAEEIGNCFPSGRGASCNYGIGKDGRVCLVVDEENRSWCTSSESNDQRAVTVECASDTKSPYKMNNKVYSKLVELCVDICKRNGKKKLLWFGSKTKTLNYKPKSDEMVLTVHRWFANKSCPGDWLYARLGDLAEEVTEQLGGSTSSDSPIVSKPTSKPTASKTEQIKVDGWWGVDTTKLLQKIFKTPVDGIVSNQDPAQKKYLLRADSKAWDFEGTGNGSDLIGAMQRHVEVKDDGFMGDKTIRAWQEFLGVKVDGYMGENTVKALQKWANKKIA